MELYKEILIHLLAQENVQISFPNINKSPTEIIELTSYHTLRRIKEILEDDTLDDSACFIKIEQIVNAFESIGSSGGNRHDFG